MNRTDLVKKATAAGRALMAMGRLSKQNYERWRFRQVPGLEKVLPGSLNQHALRAYARDELKLKPSRTGV